MTLEDYEKWKSENDIISEENYYCNTIRWILLTHKSGIVSIFYYDTDIGYVYKMRVGNRKDAINKVSLIEPVPIPLKIL